MTNYIPRIQSRFFQEVLGGNIPKTIKYINRSEDIIIFNTNVNIKHSDTKYLVLCCEYEPVDFVRLGIIHDLNDIIIQSEIADKYCVDISHNVVRYIKNNMMHPLKKWWKAICKNTATCKEPVDINHADDIIAAGDYPHHIAMNGSNYLKYHKLYDNTCDLIVYPEELIDNIINILIQTRQYTQCMDIVTYVAMHPKMCHLIFTKSIQQLFQIENMCQNMLYTVCNISINILYIQDLHTYTKSKIDDTHILKHMEELTMMNGKVAYTLQNPFNILVYTGQPRISLALAAKKCYTIPERIDVNRFKENIKTLSSGILNDTFRWDLFILTGSTIFMSLIYEGTELWDAVSDLDIIYHRNDNIGIDGLRELVEEHIVRRMPFVNMTTAIITGSKTKRIRVYQDPSVDNIKSMDIYFNSVGDISRYHSGPTNGFFDGARICGYPRFWGSLYNRSMPDFIDMKCDDPVVLKRKYMNKCGIGSDIAQLSQLIHGLQDTADAEKKMAKIHDGRHELRVRDHRIDADRLMGRIKHLLKVF
jgi:hypothetical protein